MANGIINGVSRFTTYLLEVSMPEGKEACQFCPNCKYEHDTDMRRCKCTWEPLPYYKTQIGQYCVLKVKENENEPAFTETE